jgi:hypothetical protein
MYIISGVFSAAISFIALYAALHDATGNRTAISLSLSILLGMASLLLCRAYYKKCLKWIRSIILSIAMPLFSLSSFVALILVVTMTYSPLIKFAVASGAILVVGFLMFSEKMFINKTTKD